MNSRSRHIIRFILRPRSVVLVFAAVDLVAMWIRDSRIKWGPIEYHGYYADTLEAFVLSVAALCLLSNRIWILAVAALLSMRTIYMHVFLTLRGISNAHDIPMLSAGAWRRWSLVFDFQPQYLLHLTIAILTFLTAAVLIGKSARRW